MTLALRSPSLRRDHRRPRFSPRHLPGLQLWFDAQAQAGVADGGTVATLVDRSGNGRNATTTGSPTWHQNVKNGKAAWRFNGSTMYATIADFARTLTAMTVFVVAKADVSTALTALMDGDLDTNAYAFSVGQSSIGRMTGVLSDTTDVVTHTAGTFLFTDVNILELHFGSSIGLVRVNGLVENDPNRDSTDVTTMTNSAQGFTIGGTVTAGVPAASWDGDIYEILMYDRALSAGERLRVERYLANKYAISIWNLTDVPNLSWWLSAQQIPGLADAAGVVDWDDWSTLAEVTGPTQATASLRPLFQTAEQNGRPAVQFDGTDDTLAMTGAPAGVQVGTGDFSIILVINFTTDLVTNSRFIYNGAENDTTVGWDLRVNETNGGVACDLGNGTTRVIFTVGTLALDAAHVLIITFDRDGNALGYVDGTLATTNSISSFSAVNLDSSVNFRLSGTSAVPALPFIGRLYEFAVVKRVLSSAEIALITSQFNAQYGL